MKGCLVALALALALALGVATPGAARDLSRDQAALDRLAATMGYWLSIVDNQPADCPDGKACFVSTIDLTMPPDIAPTPPGFEIRHGFTSRVLRIDSDTFDGRLINGDLNALRPKPGQRLVAGARYRVRVIGTGHYFSRFHAMPHVHLAATGLASRVVVAALPGRDAETGLETLPFVAAMTDEARLAAGSAADRTRWLTPARAFARHASRGPATPPDIVILPRPAAATRGSGAGADLTHGMRLSLDGIDRRAVTAALAALAVPTAAGGTPVSVGHDGSLPAEGYRLAIGGGRIAIAAADAAGASHALRSLAQQAAFEHNRLRPLTVVDAPRYPFRGLHIDVARNFHGKAELLKLIEQAAIYKLNRLHLHLGDDEGWRLEVKALPELTAIGGFRCFDDGERRCLQPQLGGGPGRDAPTNGYLTQDDYRAILIAAKARGIEVIPSFDMPGHSRAAIRSMEARHARLAAAGRTADADRYRLVEPGDRTAYRSVQNYDDNTLNVCLDATYRFLGTVLDEVQALHRRAGTPLRTYHIGADETAGAWSGSPACRALLARTGMRPAQLGAYFVERVARDLARRGVRVAGWSDGMGHTAADRMPAAVQANIWGGLHTGGVTEAHVLANRGWSVVLSMPDMSYFDMPNAVDPDEPGFDWAAREVDLWQAFAFMPGNLPANGSLRRDILDRPTPVDDAVPLAPGRVIAGVQAQLWSETVRTDAQVDYMLFPRLLALAERGWSRPAWEPAYRPGASYRPGDGKVDVAAVDAGWRDFAGRVGVALRRLDRAGVAYRLAPPGARIVQGILEANSELPGTRIEYRTGSGGWRPYTGPVAVAGPVTLRTRSTDDTRAGRSVTLIESR